MMMPSMGMSARGRYPARRSTYSRAGYMSPWSNFGPYPSLGMMDYMGGMGDMGEDYDDLSWDY
jgi:hypothetical protein